MPVVLGRLPNESISSGPQPTGLYTIWYSMPCVFHRVTNMRHVFYDQLDHQEVCPLIIIGPGSS